MLKCSAVSVHECPISEHLLDEATEQWAQQNGLTLQDEMQEQLAPKPVAQQKPQREKPQEEQSVKGKLGHIVEQRAQAKLEEHDHEQYEPEEESTPTSSTFLESMTSAWAAPATISEGRNEAAQSNSGTSSAPEPKGSSSSSGCRSS